MVKRALLISSQILGLAGCDADVQLILGVLERRGFDQITPVTGADASREGMLDAFASLVASTRPGDAVVVYYSGHGGRVQHPAWRERFTRGETGYLQFLVPWDIEASTEDDFRGVMAEELTQLQRRLTEVTHNVTTILDCCHSGYMARNAVMVPKSVNRTFPIAGLLARVEGLPPERRYADAATNPYAVRVVACGPDQSAFERSSPLSGQPHGVLTEALAAVLEEIGDRPISWITTGDLVQRRVLAAVPEQRPEVEGPAERLPFSLDGRTRTVAFPVKSKGGEAVIEAAPILGIASGDTFQLMPPDEERTLATARVEHIGPQGAVLSVALAAGMAHLPESCDAVPVQSSVPRAAVRVAVPGDAGDALRAEVGRSQRLRVAEGDEPAFTVVPGDGGLVVQDEAGLPVRTSVLGDDDAGRRGAVALLELLAAAERLRTLGSGTGGAALDDPVEIELHTHEGSERTLRNRGGEQLFKDDLMSLTIRNRSDRDLFVWVFDIGVSRHVSLVTNESPSGKRLDAVGAGAAHTIHGPAGAALWWPPDVPNDTGRLETLVVIIADRHQNLRPLETPRAGARRALAEPRSPLEAVLEEFRSGTREMPSTLDAQPLRYRVERIDFVLQPRPRPRLDEPAFEIDDRPDPTLRTLLPKAAQPPPAKVAVLLSELVVRKNRALFRADVRIDTLVVTRAGDIAYPRTFFVPRVADGERLPMDDVLLYHGEVQELLELAIWVTRDDHKGPLLAELFAKEMTSEEVAKALTALGGLALAAPQAAAAVGAVAAVATLIRVAASLVKAATGKDIGVYRTSKLAHERFGLGRTPPQGRRQAQDLEFAYEVVEVE